MMVWVVASVALGVLLLYGTTIFYCAEMFTRSKRRRVQGTPEDMGLRFEDIRFRAPDMTVLRGWFLESPGARASVVLVHSDDGTRADTDVGLMRLQRAYVRNGFNVFAFDLRGRGESSGERDHLGSAEQVDLEAAVGYVRRRSGGIPVVLHGFGLGAALAIQASADGLEVGALIADSTFGSAREQLRLRWNRVPSVIFGPACWVARKVYHADVDALRPVAAMSRIKAPLLLVHGALDDVVPLACAHNLLAASLSQSSELWVVPEAAHLQGFNVAGDEYLRRCMRVIDTAVPARTIRHMSTAALVAV
ncbi:MAG: alpha/beta fold hydrolase [Dehalococcoidia bacterium]|nr:alpha/beta fold hydrolase [Dehalococcoidia bacterium]